jgi:hypothetical protein
MQGGAPRAVPAGRWGKISADATQGRSALVALGARALVFAIEDGRLGDWLAFAVGEVLLAAFAVVLLTALDEAAAPP